MAREKRSQWLSPVGPLVGERRVGSARRNACEEALGERAEVVSLGRPPLSVSREKRSRLERPPSVSRETRSVFEERRCKRFFVRKPLASPPTLSLAPRPVLEARRCEKFEGENGDLPAPSKREGRLSAFEETRCALRERLVERFDVGRPLAARLSGCVEPLSGCVEPLSVFGKTRSKGSRREKAHAERLSAFGEPRSKRVATEEPLASPRSAFERRRSLFEERLSMLAEPRSLFEERLSTVAEPRSPFEPQSLLPF